MDGEVIDDITITNNSKLICEVDQVSLSLLTDLNNQQGCEISTNGNEQVSVSSLMSQVRLLESDKGDDKYFPEGKYDYFGQQVDLRPVLFFINRLG
jgi:hypothetical protein